MKKIFKKVILFLFAFLISISVLIPTANHKASAAPSNTFLWPVPSSYSMSRAFSTHKAVDINKCEGKNIVASYDGTVYSYVNKCQHYSKSCTSCDSTGMGVGLILKHSINGTTYYTYYAHMKYNSVPSAYRTTGASVKQGDIIGKVGSSGNSSGPHMHFAVTEGKTWNNYLNNTPTDSGKHNITSSSGISYKYSTSYTLTYNANGGSGAPASQTGATSYTISSVYPERFGYTFEGWATSSNASYFEYLPDESITLSSNTTLYAVWSNDFDYNDGYLAYASNYIRFTGQERYYKFIPSASGYYIFDTGNTDEGLDTKGYLYNSSGTELAYNDDGGITADGSVPTDFRIVYNLAAGNTYYIKVKGWGANTGYFMVWAYEDRELYYNANGGSGAPATQVGAINYTISSTIPTRDNYTFLGWSTNSSATSPEYQPGDYIALTDPTTLYAVWKKAASGSKPAAPTVSISSTSVIEGDSVTLTWTAVPNVTNYWVSGFKGDERVMGEIDNSRSKKLTLEAGTYNFSVVAINSYGETTGNWVWFTVEEPSYTLSYNANGGSNPPSTQSDATSYTISSAKPTRNGYTFLGWSKSSTATSPSYVSGDKITLTANTTLYAVWQKNPVAVITPTIEIKNNPNTATIKYGDILQLTAETTNMPEGAYVAWYYKGTEGAFEYGKSDDSYYCQILSLDDGSVTITAVVVDKNGNPILDADGNEISDSQTINSKAGFWQILLSLFKTLFGFNRIIVQSLSKFI